MSYRVNLERETLRNVNYRKVLFTTPNMQLVLMRLRPGESIGLETHPHTTQFIRVEGGVARVKAGSKRYVLRDGAAVVIAPGTWHDVRNASPSEDLSLYTLYSPPEHAPGTLQKHKQD